MKKQEQDNRSSIQKQQIYKKILERLTTLQIPSGLSSLCRQSRFTKDTGKWKAVGNLYSWWDP